GHGPMPERIGPYRIVDRIGQGGMGEVYEAEQERPVRRKVALKLIKTGMDSKPIIARFESERQALAMMNHPCIARVFDGGTTENGLPYFVMEFVDGMPIDEYCDNNRMTTRQRLELFIDVCEGVQHAHQKGIIHRDLKPQNILVKSEGERAVPKVIDFGIAKPMSERLTDSTYVTAAGLPIGTPEYMSPEQSGLGNVDVDTRTDVYSLGALLYELLVGARPFDIKQMKLKGIDELWKCIREDDAPKPSTRISTVVATSPDTARARRTDLTHLTRELRGDLDWILLKALEKDRTRRYSSASEFAADVQRHLNHEPVLASPPSATYRCKKFVIRHKLGVTAAALVAVAVALGITGTTVALVRAVRAEKLAVIEAERANEQTRISEQTLKFMVGLFAVVDPSEARGNTVTAREILDKGASRVEKELAGQPKAQATLMATMGTVYRSLGLYDAAEPLFQKALNKQRLLFSDAHPEVAHTLNDYATLLVKKGSFEAAEPLYREALAMRRELFGGEHENVAESLNDLAYLLCQNGDFAAAELMNRQSLDMRRRLLGKESEAVAESQHNLAMNLHDQGDADSPMPLLRESLAMRRRLLGKFHPDVSESLNSLAFVLYSRGEFDKAEPLFREALEVQKQLVGEVHPDVAMAMNNLAFVLHDSGEYDAAEAIYREVLTVQRTLLGDDHPDIAKVMNNLAFVLIENGSVDEAEKFARDSLAMYRRVHGDNHPDVARGLNNLARWLQDKGKMVEAERMYREAVAMRRDLLGDDHPATAVSLTGLAHLLISAQRFGEALESAEEARATMASALSESHWRTAVADGVVGAALAGLGRFDEAESLLLKSFKTVQAEKGASIYAEDARQRLIGLYEAWGRREEAAPYRATSQEVPSESN
ncbi:MAG: serine/threonine-protein kinase, partial [Gammaproteobacteria bacterium]|nr:serine/threonine-protein kinase [Gammaproteobacteria bacterium]